MGNMTVRARLLLLVTCMTVAMLVVGLVGINTAKNQEAEIEGMYEHVVLPGREVARIRRLVAENVGQVFRAFQHNPAFEYAKLHEHPLAVHLDVVNKNLKWIDDTFGSLRSSLVAGSEGAKQMQEIEAFYQDYVKSTLNPTVGALNAGNYGADVVDRFIKANGAFEGKFFQMMRAFAEAQEQSAKQQHKRAIENSREAIQQSILLIIVGLAAGSFLAFVTIRSITVPLQDMQTLMHRAADDHDFTGQVTVRAHDEIGSAAKAFNDLMQTLRRTLAQIRQNTVRLDDASAALATAAAQASIASNETSESAASMAASVEEMSVSITSVSDSTRDALALAQDAGEHSGTGGAVIEAAVRDMAQIADQVRQVGGTISILGDHSNKISSVVQVIKDVADQTNLLALNAAIEAARAGEAGRGFAVVADEVRKLAERTTQATGEIGQMIGAIQGSAHSAVDAMHTTIGTLERGTEEAALAGKAIVAIQESNARVLEVVRNISDAMSEQGAASQEIAQRVERVAQASEENCTSVGVSADTAQSIHQLSMEMRRSVDVFKV